MSLLTKGALDIERVRADFPILATLVNGRPLVYLDNGATSQKPNAVIDAMDRYWKETNANIHRGVHYLSQKSTREYDEARDAGQILLNARSSKEVVFTAGCTASVNLVAQTWGRENLRPGDEILISTMEHHSNIVPWQILAEQNGCVVREIPITVVGEVELDAYERLLSERTKLVAIVHVSNALGTINPVGEMIRSAHRVGAKVLVDGAQAAPHTRVDVQALDTDFYVLSCHKMYAPTGVGILFGKLELLEAMPPYQGGGDMIHTVSFEKTTYAELPHKFEAGTPNIAGVVGFGTTVEYLASLGGALLEDPEASLKDRLDTCYAWIEERERELLAYGTSVLTEIPGLTLTGTAAHKAAILAFTMDCAHPHDVGTILDNEGIAVRTGHHCCMPLMRRLGVPATTRASLGLYNTQDEIDRLAFGVKRVREMFG